MTLSDKTLALLQNFATIADDILIPPGNTLHLKNQAVYARATIEEDIPVEVGISGLTRFLGLIRSFESPIFDFGETAVRIVDSGGSPEAMYYYVPAELVDTKPPKMKPQLPTNVIEFDFPEEQMLAVSRVASILRKTELGLISDGSALWVQTDDRKNRTGHVYKSRLNADPQGRKCNIMLQLSNLKLLKGSYHGAVNSKYAVFENVSGYDLTYYIGVDPLSTFGEG